MPARTRPLIGLGVISLLGACTFGSDENASASSDAVEEKACSTSSSCFVAEAALTGRIERTLGTAIDSGWLSKGNVNVRTRFTIGPPKDEPLFIAEMPRGALLETSWSRSSKGVITIKPRTERKTAGEMKVHYTLVPTLQAKLFGVQVNYDSTELLDRLEGASFDYDAKSEAPLAPWGFEGAQMTVAAPRLEESTIFGLPLADLGVHPKTAEGKLAIQAIARPTFTYKTTAIQLDGERIRSADGSTNIPIGDYDAVDVVAQVQGELELSGELDVRPVVKVDTIAEVPMLGLVSYSFSVASRSFHAISPVQFDPTPVHIPLPNVKVPARPFSLGTAQTNAPVTKRVAIENTGELAAVLKIESSNPKFVVPSGEIRIEPKSKYHFKIAFQPEGSGPSSAKITVTSNDPDSPEQSFRVSANGPKMVDELAEEEPEPTEVEDEPAPAPKTKTSEGCSVLANGTGSARASTPWAIALGLGLLFRSRRRRTESP